MDDKFDFEETIMMIIAMSGDARAKAFNALKEAKKNNFKKAKELLEEAQKSSFEAHNYQTNLLFAEAEGEEIPSSILLIHAQDHFMTSLLAIELITEIIELRKEIKEE